MTVAELKREASKLSSSEQMELAAYLTNGVQRAANHRKDVERMMDDGDPNFTDPRDEVLQTNRF